MSEAKARLLQLHDDALPALGPMLGAGAVGMLEAAVESRGERLRSARPAQVTWRPGRSLAVTYDARLASGAEVAHPESLVAATGSVMPDGAITLERDGARARESITR
jgi:hypothetical protein